MNKYDDTDYQIEREESIEYEEKTENIEEDKLSDSCLNVIRNDIKEAKDYGMECDRVQWLKLLNRIEEVI